MVQALVESEDILCITIPPSLLIPSNSNDVD
jgi:hypothetical protein